MSLAITYYRAHPSFSRSKLDMQHQSGSSPAITVSAIIPTYNRARYLPEALDSILGQTRPPEEILVVDDGSSDDTDAVVSRYGGQIRYFRLPENGGKSVALNHAIPVAEGSHIWIFDDDDIALPDSLQSHVTFLSDNQSVDFSYSTNYVFEGDGNIWNRGKWKLKQLPNWPPDEFFIQHVLNMHAMMQGMLVPKRCYDAVGYFDPVLLRSEDLEMVIRLARHFTAANLLKPTFVLREHHGLRGPKSQRHAANQRAKVWLPYQQQIYRRMRADFPLSAYLPHPPGTDPPIVDARQRALALLQRGAIMLQQGMMDESLADLRLAFDLLDVTEPIVVQTAHTLSLAFDVDAWRLSKPYGFIVEIARCPTPARTTELRIAIIKGIYWALRRAIRQHRWRDAWRSTLMLATSLLLFIPSHHRRGPRFR